MTIRSDSKLSQIIDLAAKSKISEALMKFDLPGSVQDEEAGALEKLRQLLFGIKNIQGGIFYRV